MQSTSETASTVQTSTVQSGANKPSRLIIRTQNSNPSVIRFDTTNNPNYVYEWGLNPTSGEFTLANPFRSVMRISQDGQLVDMSDHILLRAYNLEIENLWAFADTQMYFNGVPQWKLTYDEVFMVGQQAEGWSLPEATSK